MDLFQSALRDQLYFYLQIVFLEKMLYIKYGEIIKNQISKSRYYKTFKEKIENCERNIVNDRITVLIIS